MNILNHCLVRVGRLMEISVAAGYHSVQDVNEMMTMIRGELVKFPSDYKLIIVADWRHCKLMPQEVADRALQMLTIVNDRIERSAILHNEDAPTSVLQLMRLVKESHFEHRRIFTEPPRLQQWLDSSLTPQERARLKAFLSSH